MKIHKFIPFALVLIVAACATIVGLNYDERFGDQKVRDRRIDPGSPQGEFFLSDVKPIIDNRCVVCHACYDAPCQLKMSSVEGIDRGGSKHLVYDGTRLIATKPTRLFEDAQTTEQWREMEFHPVLNERDQNPTANLEAGLVARLLEQKQQHPLPQQDQLEGFDFGIYREQVCPSIEEYEKYKKDHPTWGMPYGMPNLAPKEYTTLTKWLRDGAMMSKQIPLTAEQQALVDEYEQLLNGDALKVQLTARYIYEHLFLSHLYFSEFDAERPRFFNLVRSSTPPGQPVKRIPTRRPYDDPTVERVYYRIIPEQATIVDKTHMPYALNSARIAKWKKWFIDPDYSVTALPGYEPEVAANPMTAFTDLPIKARFEFMIDDAQNTINAFIKGPVCRGQIALNVINDRFWVFFLDPEKTDIPAINEFYRSQEDNLKLPGELQSNALPLVNWIEFSEQQARFLEAKSTFVNGWFKDGHHLSIDAIWAGDGVNPNAALTVFRHYDSASVVKGLVGTPPKTAWVLDYELIERIHYLLVAGFDVYGNFGHQLLTRMFMDFLRMEGESNFIAFLPQDVRHKELSSWYKDQHPQLSHFLMRNVKPFDQPSMVPYQTDDPKKELYGILKTRLAPVLTHRYEIKNTGLSAEHERLLRSVNHIKGEGLVHVPQLVMIMVESSAGEKQMFTMIHNNAHTNISSIFDEKDNRDPKNDDLTLARGLIGSYPGAYLSLQESDIPRFVEMVRNIRTENDYVKLLDQFAVRRSSPGFWSYSDAVFQWYRKTQPVEFGLLDYNRFENR